MVDAEVSRYVGDGATGVEDHPGTAIQQLFGVLPLSCHGLIGSLPPGGILASRSPSNPAWLTVKRAGLTLVDVYGLYTDGILRQPLDERAHTKAVYIARAG